MKNSSFGKETRRWKQKKKLLYLDIETTAASTGNNSALSVIGCCEKGREPRQWFNESGLEQKQILASFLSCADSYDVIVTYNVYFSFSFSKASSFSF